MTQYFAQRARAVTIALSAVVALSICLMSLGGPFWFEALKNLLKLRPVLAKEEQERQERREVLPGGAGGLPAVSGPQAGDRGAGAGADRAR